MAPGGKFFDPFQRGKLSKDELKRRRMAITKSKVGLTLAMLHMELQRKRELIRDGKLPLGITAENLNTLLAEIQVVLVNVRDFYVDEVSPKSGVKR